MMHAVKCQFNSLRPSIWPLDEPPGLGSIQALGPETEEEREASFREVDQEGKESRHRATPLASFLAEGTFDSLPDIPVLRMVDRMNIYALDAWSLRAQMSSWSML